MCIYHILSIHSSINGCFGYFYLWPLQIIYCGVQTLKVHWKLLIGKWRSLSWALRGLIWQLWVISLEAVLIVCISNNRVNSGEWKQLKVVVRFNNIFILELGTVLLQCSWHTAPHKFTAQWFYASWSDHHSELPEHSSSHIDTKLKK